MYRDPLLGQRQLPAAVRSRSLVTLVLVLVCGCQLLPDGRCLHAGRGVLLRGTLAMPHPAPAATALLAVGETRGGGAVPSSQDLTWFVTGGPPVRAQVTAVHVHVGAPAGSAAPVLLALPIVPRPLGAPVDVDTIIAFGNLRVMPGEPLFPGAPAFETIRLALLRGPVYLDVHTADAPADAVGGVLVRDPNGPSVDWSRAHCS